MIRTIKGDITDLTYEAIVNAANNHLNMRAGVAGAIKRKGGASIEEEAVAKGPVPVGEAVVTAAGALPARYVIHAAAMGQDLVTDAAKVRAATRNALLRAEELGLKNIAFPALGTGVGGLDFNRSASVMVSEARRHLAGGSSLDEVAFVLFDDKGFSSFNKFTARNKVVCLGDSITYGFPYGPGASWVELCGRALGIRMINKGVNGDTTHGMWLRFNSDVASLSPAYVIIMGGANDAFVGYSLEEVGESVTDLVEEAYENGICPLLGLPAPVNLGTYVPDDVGIASCALDSFRNWMKEFAAEQLLPALDFYTPLLDKATGTAQPGYFLDEAHPSKTGYMAMAKSVEPVLSHLKKAL